MGRIGKFFIGACLVLAFASPVCAEKFTLVDETCNCSSTFEEGTVVILTATPDIGSVFMGWSGDCTGKKKTCELIMDGDKKVNAKFNKKPITPAWRRSNM
jgi:uncharacterized repeat protein (TIGR02543 family)